MFGEEAMYTSYIGTQRISARPMTRLEYNALRGWVMPENEDGSDLGYYSKDAAGHTTWTPKATFERHFREVSEGQAFGDAIDAMKRGRRVHRNGWNGKGMYLYMVPAGRYPPSTPAGHAIAQDQGDNLVPYAPYIAMKTVQGEVVPWLASQTDVLAEDWIIL
jgi:hypothetical protein